MCCFYYTYTLYIFCGLPKREIDKLQRAQNCAARLVSGIRSDHVTPVMKDLHSVFLLAHASILKYCF